LRSGATRGLSQGGQSLPEGVPLVTVGEPTSKNSEKGEEMIVNLWMSWMSILDKKENTPKNPKKQIKEQ